MTDQAYCVFDLETTIYTSFSRRANPFDPRNWIVLAGWKYPDSVWGTAAGFESERESRPHSWFRDMLKRTKLLVGFNIKFDIHHAIIQNDENYTAWMDWIADGGQIWDCQLAEYMLDGMGQASQYLSLDEVAPRYGGNVKIDEVKELWAAGVNTDEIDPDLLYRYLVGNKETEEQGDLGNTELIFKGQLKRARKHGQLKSLLVNMGSLVYTTEAEYRGMFTDYAKGCEIAKELEQELVELKAELESHLPKLPFEFNWGSRIQLSALIFGGNVKYKARVPIYDDEGNPTYSKREDECFLVVDTNGAETTMTQAEWDQYGPESGCELVRFKSGKRAGEVKTKKVKSDDLTKPKSRIEEFIYTFPGFTEPDREWQGATPGVYSTGADVMAALGERDIPFLKTLSRYAGATKDLGTYFITDDGKGGKKGMLTLVHDDGVIHHSLNHTSTVTGRFSSTKPNLQNLSSGDKSQVKKVFVSRWGDEGVVIQSDFTALEIYIQAILTGSVNMIDDLAKGLDMHCVRVAQSSHVPYNDDLLLLCKGDDEKGIAPDKEWKNKRKKAKVYSFQRAYGAGIAKIAKSTGMSEEEAQAFADADNERYPEVEPFYEQVTQAIEDSAQPTSQIVAHPDFPAKTVQLCRGSYRTPDRKLYTYVQQPAPKFVVERRGQWTSFSPTEIKNYIVQGTGAEWAKAAMWIAVRAFYKRRNFDGKAVLVNQVHDACYADAHKSVAKEAAALLHASMEAASAFMEWYFNWHQPVHVPSDTTWGPSMADELGIEGLHALLPAAREEVRAVYRGH